MYIVCVTVWVQEGMGDAFLAATAANRAGTRQEPGNVRFDVLQKVDDPHQFFLYEVYRRSEDFTAHQQTTHYLKWREAVAPLMAQSRVGIKHHSVLPGDEQWQE